MASRPPKSIAMPGEAGSYVANGSDWEFMDWARAELLAGRWGAPALAAVEIGGEGPFWQATFDSAVMAAQIPRLAALLKEVT